jgi:hypothetical protein
MDMDLIMGMAIILDMAIVLDMAIIQDMSVAMGLGLVVTDIFPVVIRRRNKAAEEGDGGRRRRKAGAEGDGGERCRRRRAATKRSRLFLNGVDDMIKKNSVMALLPEVLTDYLGEILDLDSEVKLIKLVPVRFGSGVVQEIVLQGRSGSETRRVFGFTPVNTSLVVNREENLISLLAAEE